MLKIVKINLKAYNKVMRHNLHFSPVENQNDLELDFKGVFFFVDSCCAGIVLDESN